MSMLLNPKAVGERLLAQRIIDPSGCWLWGGYIDPGGYGQIRVASLTNTSARLRCRRCSRDGLRRWRASVLAALVAAFMLFPAVPARADSGLPPGAIKQPGQSCATVVQPPDYAGCPGPPNDVIPDGTPTGHNWCQGPPAAIGECHAAEQGFFTQLHFAGRDALERCIIARENGGDYGRSSNPSHFGRYQFSPSLWASGGGQDDWGSASPGEQDWIFVRVIDAGGAGNWRPYDGC